MLTPSKLDIPAYLMNVPVSYSTNIVNNAWMRDLEEERRNVNITKALKQFFELYSFIASEAFVLPVPTPRNCLNLQDLTFVASFGVVLEHLTTEDVVILPNFTAEGREGETELGMKFFEMAGYNTYVSPYKFEGEAELKHLHDNVWVGGYGIRSDLKTYEWMEREFDMKIIKLQEVDEYLYHLDTTVFPITRKHTLVCTELFTRRELAELAQYTEIINVSVDDCYSGICNSMRLHNVILNASHISELELGTEEYKVELCKNRKLVDIASELGCEVRFFNLSEFLKGGALLSCLVMHLNRNSYNIDLL